MEHIVAHFESLGVHEKWSHIHKPLRSANFVINAGILSVIFFHAGNLLRRLQACYVFSFHFLRIKHNPLPSRLSSVPVGNLSVPVGKG